MNSNTDLQAFPIFRAGTHTPMHGTAMKFSAADLGQMVSGYNSAKHSAPIVIGHPQTDAPAHGWIEKLSVNKGTLFATPSEVSPSPASRTREGVPKCRQISFTLHPPTIPAMASGSMWAGATAKRCAERASHGEIRRRGRRDGVYL